MATHDPHRHGNPRDEAVELHAPVTPTVAEAPPPAVTDVVFDFAGGKAPDLRGLTMILTAQQIAEKGHVQVWLTNVPERTWAILRALGLDPLFARFPKPRTQPS